MPRCSRWQWPWLLLLEQLRRGALAATAKGLQARATDDDDDDAEAWCFFDRFRGFKRVSFCKIGDDCHTIRSMLSSARSGGLTRGVEGRATRMQMPRRRQHFQSTRLTLSSSFFLLLLSLSLSVLPAQPSSLVAHSRSRRSLLLSPLTALRQRAAVERATGIIEGGAKKKEKRKERERFFRFSFSKEGVIFFAPLFSSPLQKKFLLFFFLSRK